jgi:hypothetical protein
MKAMSSRQNKKGNPSSYYNPKQQNEDKDYKRSSEIIRMLNDKSYGKPENNYADTPKEKTQSPDPVKYLKQQMLVMDSLEKSRDPEYQINWQLKKNSKPTKKNGRVS